MHAELTKRLNEMIKASRNDLRLRIVGTNRDLFYLCLLHRRRNGSILRKNIAAFKSSGRFPVRFRYISESVPLKYADTHLIRSEDCFIGSVLRSFELRRILNKNG